MKKQLLLASTVIALLATSCSKNESEKTETQQDGYIHVTSSIVGENTKAITAKDAALTGIQFRRVDNADPAVDVTTLDFVTGTRAKALTGARATGDNGGVTFTPAEFYDKATDDAAFFFGYHGTTAGTDVDADKVTTFAIDGRTDILLTDIWKAGTFTTPVSTGMIFKHALTRVEIIAVAEAGIADAVVKDGWGKITSITVLAAPTAKVAWAKPAVTLDGTVSSLLLSAGAAYAAAFTEADITTSDYANAPVIAGAMIGVPTTATNTVTLKVTTEKVAEQTVTATITPGNLTASKIHKFTLTFGTPDKPIKATASTIEDWSGGDSGTGTVVPPAIP